MVGMLKAGSHDTREVDFIALLRMIYREKLVILSCVFLSFLIGVAYIFYSVPVYEIKASLSEPNEGDVAAFNKVILLGDKSIAPLKVSSVYQTFSNVLFSISIKKYFFNRYYLPSLKVKPKSNMDMAHAYNAFSRMLSINVIKGANSVSYEVAIKGTDPQSLAVWLKQFIRLVNNRTVNSLFNSINQQRVVAIYKLERQINVLKDVAQKQKLDHMAQLNEAINIAQSAKINTPLENQHLNEYNMYMLGVNILRAKIKNLSERDSNDAYVPKLRELQGKLDFYKSYNFNRKEVKLFHLDGNIETPVIPIAPKKKLILIISLLLGLVAGGVLGIARILRRNVHALNHSG